LRKTDVSVPFALALVAASAVAAGVITACSSNDAGDASVKAEVQKPGKDVTILQAWLGEQHDTVAIADGSVPGFGAKYLVPPKSCKEQERRTFPSSSGGTYDMVRADCAEGLRELAKIPGNPGKSPLITPAIHEWEESHGRTMTHTGACEIVELRAVVPNDVVAQPSFEGIGFYWSGYSRGTMTFTPKSDLHVVSAGDVALVDGRAAKVYRFIAQGFCYGLGGSGDSIAHRYYNFKPYAQYKGSDGNTYKVWDDVEKDYLLGLAPGASTGSAPFVKDFDRAAELLEK
jgi:hypothetical protein